MSLPIVFLALLATVSMLLFFPLNRRKSHLRKSPYVKYIPFLPAFIVPYLALFPYVVFSMFAVLLVTPLAARMYVSIIFGSLVAAVIWYFFPSGVAERPKVIPRGPFTKTVVWMYHHDPRCNAFPSSHAYTAILCSYYLTYAFPLHEGLIWACGATIVSSTLFVKQHHFVDLIAGGALAATSIGVSYLVLGGLS